MVDVERIERREFECPKCWEKGFGQARWVRGVEMERKYDQEWNDTNIWQCPVCKNIEVLE